MKALLLTAAAWMAAAGSMFAQNLPPDYNWEAGVNLGGSECTRPLGPANEYQGTRTNIVPDLSVHVNHFFNDHWMLGFDVGSRKWESYGSWMQNGTAGQTLPRQEVSILVAAHAITESFDLNYMIPHYSKYHNYLKSNLYFGVMLGMVTTVNDGSIGYSNRGKGIDSGAVYVSSYDYGFGIGYSFGVQLGYTYYFMPRFGIGAEVAARYANVNTHDLNYGGENSNFYLLYFPATLNLRYRF